MREKILINHDWRCLVNPPAAPSVKTKVGMYLSAKTERLQWGAGSYTHGDVAESWTDKGELNSEPWINVDIPHDYIIDQTPCKDESGSLGYFKYFPAWYRKHFTLSPEDEGKRLAIYFEGITGISDIYINGCFLKHNNGGYVSFEVDITDLAMFDKENVLSIYVDPNSYETWWYEGGGIYRNVWLVKTDPVAVDLWGVFVPVKKLDEVTWQVPVEVAVKNIGYTDEAVKIQCEIIDPGQNKVTEFGFEGTASARNVTALKGETIIVSPELWDIDSPRQYTVKVSVSKLIDGVFGVCDIYEQRFGFREVKFTADKGFFLNGRNVKFKGVCAHLDFGLTGKAVPDNICRYKVKLFKDMGCNAFRTSHYPHNEATMDACDEMGLLVMDETRRFETNDEAMAQFEMLIKRDRNRPSVFIWSTGNEEPYHCRPQGHRIHKALAHLAKKLDPTRLTTTAISSPLESTLQGECDVIGINYNLKEWENIHNKYPDKPFFSSEICAVGSTRGWYFGNSAESGCMDARDKLTGVCMGFCGREAAWHLLMSQPWNAGSFQWDAIEHRGEAIWPRLCSVSGAIDLFLQRKDAFYQNQSYWLDTPMIHVLPHWTHPGLEGMPINVWVYTNCDEAELFLNGVSLGKHAIEKWTHGEWNVPYEPGCLKAVGYINGKCQAEDCQTTAGRPVGLKLQLENGPVYANGEDIALFTCIAVDEQGMEVPNATPVVEFDCTGFGRIVGTGSSNTDHVPVTSLQRKMHAGRISVAVKMGCLPKGADHATMTLFAKSDYLTGTYLQTDIFADDTPNGRE